ncbi:MAG: hypothetical protein Q9M09_00750, partial [Mariprofundaceae bacterium]|nr:hypothetical protein [Mariprofundaceae bacterium]
IDLPWNLNRILTIPPTTDFSTICVESAHLSKPKRKLRAFALMAKKQRGVNDYVKRADKA